MPFQSGRGFEGSRPVDGRWTRRPRGRDTGPGSRTGIVGRCVPCRSAWSTKPLRPIHATRNLRPTRMSSTSPNPPSRRSRPRSVYLGHRPVRLGSPHRPAGAPRSVAVAGRRCGARISPRASAARNREAWAPVLLEMVGVPPLGSDALTLSLSLDKAWANRLWRGRPGSAVAPGAIAISAREAADRALPAPFPLFVKPRWEGTAKGIRRSASVATRVPSSPARSSASSRLSAAGAGRGLPARRRVHGDGRRQRSAPRAARAAARARGARPGIGLHALEGPGARRARARAASPRACSTPRSKGRSRAWRCGPSRVRMSRLRARGLPVRRGRVGRPFSRSIRCRPLRRTAPSRSSPSSRAAPWPRCSRAVCGPGSSGSVSRRAADETAARRPDAGAATASAAATIGTRAVERAAVRGNGEMTESLAQTRPRARHGYPRAIARGRRRPSAGRRRSPNPTGRIGAGRCATASAAPATSRASSSRRADEQRARSRRSPTRFRFVITPYYAALMDPEDPDCPIRRQVVPRARGARRPGGPRRSARRGRPLARQERHPRLSRPDRLLRQQRVRALLPLLPAQADGRRRRSGAMKKRELETALDWIALHARDPRRAADGRRSARLLGRAARVAARPAARDPARRADPARDAAAGHAALPGDRRALRDARALPPDLGQHALQPSARAHGRGGRGLRPADAGGHPGRQPERAAARRSTTTLATMQALCERLVRMRVRPYYCYQAQLLEGTAHFRVPIERGIAIFRALRGRTSGFAIPQYVLDTPLRQGAPRTSLRARSRGRRRRRREPGTVRSGGSRIRCEPTSPREERVTRRAKHRGRSAAADASPARRGCSRRACCCRACSASCASALFADRVGSRPAADAYYAAFQIPDILNYLLAGGAPSIALRAALHERARAAGRGGGALRVAWSWAPSAIALDRGSRSLLLARRRAARRAPVPALRRRRPGARDLRLTRIVLPAQVFFVTGGDPACRADGARPLRDARRWRRSSTTPASSLGGLLRRDARREGFAWGALAGAVARTRAAIPVSMLRRLPGRDRALRVAPLRPRLPRLPVARAAADARRRAAHRGRVVRQLVRRGWSRRA